MTRPDYISEELWEKAVAVTHKTALHGSPLLTERLALALLQARNEGLREAAKVAKDAAYPDPSPLDEFEMALNGGCELISAAILSLIQEPS